MGERAAANPPEHLAALGPVPEDPMQRIEWVEKAAAVEGYREQYGIKDGIGHSPSWNDADRRLLWEQAADALGLDPSIRELSSMSDGALWTIVDQYTKHEAWLPRNVDNELRMASLALREAKTRAALARAAGEAEAILDAADVEQRMEAKRDAYQEAAAARERAYAMTSEERERHNAAKDELRLRGRIDDEPQPAPTVDIDDDAQIAVDLRRAREAMEYMNQREVDDDYTRRAQYRDMHHHSEQSREHGMER
jgi:hypothetical protein